jgi:hypothetical protein
MALPQYFKRGDVMGETANQVDRTYLEVLARHATSDEQIEWSALSQSEMGHRVDEQIIQIPEVTILVDPVIRLYLGAFNRFPDAQAPNGDFDTGAHSGFWINVNALRDGASVLDLAQAFVASQEFYSLYGKTQVDADLITAFYSHILGRNPTFAEISAWQETGLDAAHILVGFTESAEFKTISQSALSLEKLQLADAQYGIVFGASSVTWQGSAHPHAAMSNASTSQDTAPTVADSASVSDVSNEVHLVGSVSWPDNVGAGHLHYGT